jgi:hypothetical protein
MLGRDNFFALVGCCFPLFLFGLLSIYVYLRDKSKRYKK